MKLNLKIVKEFLAKDVTSSTIVILGCTYKSVRYKVDKATKDVLYDYYGFCTGGITEEDMSPEYVLITNIMDDTVPKIAQ